MQRAFAWSTHDKTWNLYELLFSEQHASGFFCFTPEILEIQILFIKGKDTLVPLKVQGFNRGLLKLMNGS